MTYGQKNIKWKISQLMYDERIEVLKKSKEKDINKL